CDRRMRGSMRSTCSERVPGVALAVLTHPERDHDFASAAGPATSSPARTRPPRARGSYTLLRRPIARRPATGKTRSLGPRGLMSRVSALRDRLLAGAALLLLVLTGMPLSARSGARKPNVVFIMMDDLGYRELRRLRHPDARARPARAGGGPAYELLHERL